MPKGAKPIGCKARLVAKGFTHKSNIDYFDTFVLVTRISSIQVLLALAVIHKLVIHQMVVKIAFLNGELEEEIYMTQLEGCVVPGQKNKVCKLLKSLYGLKQTPKQWHEKLDSVLLCDGFSPNDADKCVFSKFENGECVIICLYVDDMLIFGTCIDIVSRTKLFLGSKFEMKDMGETNMILGVRIIRKRDSILLSREQYTEKLLRKFEYYDFKPMSTPYDANNKLIKNRGESVSQPHYAQIIRSLLHLMSFSRLDIAYAVGRLSRYTQCPF